MQMITCSAVISACGQAMQLFDEMWQQGLQPEVITDNALAAFDRPGRRFCAIAVTELQY